MYGAKKKKKNDGKSAGPQKSAFTVHTFIDK